MTKCVFHKQCQLYSVSLYEKFILSFSRPVFCWNLTWQNLDGLAKLANLTELPELVIYCFELKTFITLIFNWFLLLWWVLCLKWSLKTAHLRNWLLLNKITLKKWMLKRNGNFEWYNSNICSLFSLRTSGNVTHCACLMLLKIMWFY